MAQRSIIGLSAALLLYNIYEIIAYESQRTMNRGLFCASIPPISFVTIRFMNRDVVTQNAERVMLGVIIFLIFTKHAYDIFAESNGILANAYTPVFIMAGARVRIPGICLILLCHMFALMVHYWWGSEFIEVNSR